MTSSLVANISAVNDFLIHRTDAIVLPPRLEAAIPVIATHKTALSRPHDFAKADHAFITYDFPLPASPYIKANTWFSLTQSVGIFPSSMYDDNKATAPIINARL